jgi:hypothetical protein
VARYYRKKREAKLRKRAEEEKLRSLRIEPGTIGDGSEYTPEIREAARARLIQDGFLENKV